VASDLHVEFGEFDYDFSNIDLLILAGDIHVGEKGLDWILDYVKEIPVIYVLGNHEYYKHTYPKLLHKIKAKAKGTNVHVLENESILVDGVSFHGCTLWTNFELYGDPKIAGYYSEQRMNDFQLIRIDPSYSRLRAIDTHVMHYNSLSWLKQSLEDSPTKKNVVITHHAPSIYSVHEKYKDDILSAAFASDLEKFILETNPDFWIHGHVHDFFEYSIGKTKVICNPKGYPHEGENGFSSKYIIEV